MYNPGLVPAQPPRNLEASARHHQLLWLHNITFQAIGSSVAYRLSPASMRSCMHAVLLMQASRSSRNINPASCDSAMSASVEPPFACSSGGTITIYMCSSMCATQPTGLRTCQQEQARNSDVDSAIAWQQACKDVLEELGRLGGGYMPPVDMQQHTSCNTVGASTTFPRVYKGHRHYRCPATAA